MEGFTRLDNDRLVKDTLNILDNLLQNGVIQEKVLDAIDIEDDTN